MLSDFPHILFDFEGTTMERLRRLVRYFLKYDSKLYRTLAQCVGWWSVYSHEGVAGCRLLRSVEKMPSNGEPVALKLRSLAQPFSIRPGSQDIGVVITNIFRAEYGQAMFENDPVWMIDAGAFIGDVSVFFATKYPQCHIVALEPSEESFGLLARNMQRYGDRAIPLHMGLWGEETVLHHEGATVISRLGDSGHEVRCVTIPWIMKQYGIPWLDLLKMDIEGAEVSVFQSNAQQWLPHVGQIIVEIHGDKAYQAVQDALAPQGFQMRRYRSLWYCSRDPKTTRRMRQAAMSNPTKTD
ncbi:MAG: FkbM family methyltransferase [Phycisphaerales bacterium]